MKKLATVSMVTLAVAAFGARPAVAQDRAQLVEQARSQLSDSAALDLLMRAADPDAAPRDSLWAVSVHEMALTLLGLGDQDLAGVWLRWSAREGRRWPVDRTLPPRVVDAYDRALAAVQGEGAGDEGVTTTDWRWPGTFDADAQGTLAVSGAGVPVTVNVEGQGAVSAGGELTLPPGTYRLSASADGYEPAQIKREILPGVTTEVGFALAPLLAADVESRVASTLVSIRYDQGGQQFCTTGFLARSDGVVLTSRSGLPQSSGLTVTTPGGVYNDISVAASDQDLDLAVLRLGASGQPTLSRGARPSSGAYVWSVFHPGCQPAASGRARLGDWPSSPQGLVTLASALPRDAQGAPLVDRSGALLGVVVGPDQVAPMSLAARLLERALAERVAQTNPEAAGASSGGGGPPWKWIGAGAAVVGVAAAVLGGGGGGGGEEPPPSTTGIIRVTFPGGQQ